VRERLDTLLVARGLFATRSQARAAVLAGEVSAGGRRLDKPGELVAADSDLAVAARPRYVSRGGDKLAHALAALGVEVAGAEVCDLGSSTGGFVDCLLQHGARRVVAVDVGYGLLDYRLRGDPRVTVLERTNSRHLTPDRLPFAPDFVTADVSFISLRLALGPVLECARADYRGLVLVKPQFEAGRELVGKGGVVRDPAVHLQVVAGFGAWLEQRGAAVLGACDSGHPGPRGNVEYFTYFCDARSPLAAARVDARRAASAAVEAVHG
jgi:23S rRNA (cytidine1920-2'-O)/16S rRNA (cytidine1409-2'-O)-methyltransferase